MDTNDKTRSSLENIDFDPKEPGRMPDNNHYDGDSRNSLDSTQRQAANTTQEEKNDWLDESVDDAGQSGGQSTLGTNRDVRDK